MEQQLRRISGRNGWSREETGVLFEQARLAEVGGMPIKSVFDKVAAMTGRKPNSIRNYYYLKLKEEGDRSRTAFTPFNDGEVYELMRTMLTKQAEGRSVRGIATELGGGDKKLMLRYQNKYRSMLRMKPAYVREIMQELEREGAAYVDPFAGRRSARIRSVDDALIELSRNLSRSGADTDALLAGLLSLSAAAAQPKAELCELESLARSKAELESRLSAISRRSRAYFSKSGMELISGLKDYISDMEKLI